MPEPLFQYFSGLLHAYRDTGYHGDSKESSQYSLESGLVNPSFLLEVLYAILCGCRFIFVHNAQNIPGLASIVYLPVLNLLPPTRRPCRC